MSTFVLVHGASHGAWCWHKVIPFLEDRGHRVVAIDLPGHGEDHTPVAQVTLEAYTQRICEAVEAQSERVILVGHSMGGVAISQAAERCPENIAALGYLCAFLLEDGESLLNAAQQDSESMIPPNMVPTADGAAVSIRPEAVREAFYADCSEEDVAFATARLIPQPTAPLAAPVHLTEARYGRIPRFYIECVNDRAIPIASQRQMHQKAGVREVFTIDSSHSPFFSKPETLAEELGRVAEWFSPQTEMD
jgi:pimeloyl-ACP methyl ester carboxylesterase